MNTLASPESLETYMTSVNLFRQITVVHFPPVWHEWMNFPSHFTVTRQGGEQENFNQLTLPGTHSACIAEELRDSDMAGELGEGDRMRIQTNMHRFKKETDCVHTDTDLNHIDKRRRVQVLVVFAWRNPILNSRRLFKMAGRVACLKHTLKGIWLDKYRQEEICVVVNSPPSNH